jgi:hypothetical protein
LETGFNLHRFIILIPHRDSIKAFREYRQKLFSTGINGAYSFPLSVPLAKISKPFSREELKDLALALRKLAERSAGRISGSGSAVSRLNSPGEGRLSPLESFSFFGPLIDLPIEDGIFPLKARGKILGCLFPPVLCTALIEGEALPKEEETPALSFRAAELANLSIRALAPYSFEWRIRETVWLPRESKS